MLLEGKSGHISTMRKKFKRSISINNTSTVLRPPISPHPFYKKLENQDIITKICAEFPKGEENME